MLYFNMITLLMLVLVPVLRGDIKILNTPDGPAPCARACAGVGKWDETGKWSWVNSGAFRGMVYKNVQMVDCDFATPPVVTAATKRGGTNSRDSCPSVFVDGVGASWFGVYSVGDATDATKMRSAKCDVYWTAFGYVC